MMTTIIDGGTEPALVLKEAFRRAVDGTGNFYAVRSSSLGARAFILCRLTPAQCEDVDRFMEKYQRRIPEADVAPPPAEPA